MILAATTLLFVASHLASAGIAWTAASEGFDDDAFTPEGRWSRSDGSVTSGGGKLEFEPDGQSNDWARFDCATGPNAALVVRGRVTPESSPSYATTPTIAINYASGEHISIAIDGPLVHAFYTDRDGRHDIWMNPTNHSQRHGEWSTNRYEIAPSQISVWEDPEDDGTYIHVATFRQNQSPDDHPIDWTVMQSYDARMQVDRVTIEETLLDAPVNAVLPVGTCR